MASFQEIPHIVLIFPLLTLNRSSKCWLGRSVKIQSNCLGLSMAAHTGNGIYQYPSYQHYIDLGIS